MNNLPFDILFYIFEFLFPQERIKIKTVSKTFYDVYLKHLLSKNNLNPNKYIFYRTTTSNNIIYNIVHSDEKFIHLRPLKRSKKETKVKKLFNKHGVIYCKFIRDYLYVYEKEHKEKIGRDIYTYYHWKNKISIRKPKYKKREHPSYHIIIDKELEKSIYILENKIKNNYLTIETNSDWSNCN